MTILVKTNGDLCRRLVFSQQGGAPYDLSGLELRMSVSRQRGSLAVALHLTSTDGSIDVVNPEAGEVWLRKPMREIAHLSGEYFFDVLALSSTGRRVIMDDSITFSPGVTQ